MTDLFVRTVHDQHQGELSLSLHEFHHLVLHGVVGSGGGAEESFPTVAEPEEEHGD